MDEVAHDWTLTTGCRVSNAVSCLHCTEASLSSSLSLLLSTGGLVPNPLVYVQWASQNKLRGTVRQLRMTG